MFEQIARFLVETASGFFVFLLLARFHFHWLQVPFRNQIGEFIVVCTNWIVRPMRRVVPPLAGQDLATWIAAWLLQGATLYVVLTIRGGDLGAAPGVAFAGLAGLALIDLLRFSLHILVFAVIVQVVLSWVSAHHPMAFLFGAVTQRFLRPIRRVVPAVAGIDLSPLVLLVLLQVVLIPIEYVRAAVSLASRVAA